MTDSEMLCVSSADLVNDTYKLNLSDKQIDALSANTCITVIGGLDYENELCETLRLFKCKTLAEKYIVELLNPVNAYSMHDYVYVQIQEIIAGASYD